MCIVEAAARIVVVSLATRTEKAVEPHGHPTLPVVACAAVAMVEADGIRYNFHD
jgi:hypothetical protein